VALRQLVDRFQLGRRYTVRQVNALREQDGTAYWRTDG
jgi:hypothetical protein